MRSCNEKFQRELPEHTTQGAKKSNSLSASCGKHNWLFVNQLHEIGGSRQREETKTFACQEDAKVFFDEQAAKFLGVFGRLANTSIERSDSELLIDINGVRIVKMSYLAVLNECA